VGCSLGAAQCIRRCLGTLCIRYWRNPPDGTQECPQARPDKPSGVSVWGTKHCLWESDCQTLSSIFIDQMRALTSWHGFSDCDRDRMACYGTKHLVSSARCPSLCGCSVHEGPSWPLSINWAFGSEKQIVCRGSESIVLWEGKTWSCEIKPGCHGDQETLEMPGNVDSVTREACSEQSQPKLAMWLKQSRPWEWCCPTHLELHHPAPCQVNARPDTGRYCLFWLVLVLVCFLFLVFLFVQFGMEAFTIIHLPEVFSFLFDCWGFSIVKCILNVFA
jgi:hypothetical protein